MSIVDTGSVVCSLSLLILEEVIREIISLDYQEVILKLTFI